MLFLLLWCVCLVGRTRVQLGLLSAYWCPHHLNGGQVTPKMQTGHCPSSGCPYASPWASPRNASCFKLVRFLWNHDDTLTAREQSLLSHLPASWIPWIESIFCLLGQPLLGPFKWMNHTGRLTFGPSSCFPQCPDLLLCFGGLGL